MVRHSQLYRFKQVANKARQDFEPCFIKKMQVVDIGDVLENFDWVDIGDVLGNAQKSV